MRIADITTLTFDCYGTLIDWESGLIDAMQPWRARTGVTASEAQLLEAFGREESAAQARTPSLLYPRILALTLRAIGTQFRAAPTVEEERAFAASVGDWPAFDDTAGALAELSKRFRLAILSNVDRASFARTLPKLGVAFDHVYTAEEIGSYKPDPRNFRYALARLGEAGVAAGQILHVAQSLFHDHVPAKGLGLATAWIDRPRRWPGGGATPPATAAPDCQFASLAALVRLLCD